MGEKGAVEEVQRVVERSRRGARGGGASGCVCKGDNRERISERKALYGRGCEVERLVGGRGDQEEGKSRWRRTRRCLCEGDS